MTTLIPSKAQILVIGGGPGGSYAATVLAREGFDVVILERAKFPRYHIGESMLPSIRAFTRFIDMEEKLINHGFCVKPGAAVKFVQDKKEGYTDFIVRDPTNTSWNVVRSELDEMLLRNAASVGVNVFEEVTVNTIEFADENVQGRPIAATWSGKQGKTGRISFDYLVDASGRNGIMSTRYLKNRKFNKSLDNVACWGYWKGTKQYMPGTTRENAPWFESLTDESGWNWFIPLHDGTTSVGVVMGQSTSNVRKQEARSANMGNPTSLKEHYLRALKLTPSILGLIGPDAELVKKDGLPEVHAASDFSYAADAYGGDHFRLVGDAAAFIDPFFSSGVHLAFTDALCAAATISSSIRGEFPEEECVSFHTKKVGTAYTRFLLVVMSAYKQMRSQSKPVLSDFDEDNFDRAFELLRPVIQGAADAGKRLTDDEVDKTMDLCRWVFTPATDPAMFDRVGARIDHKLMDFTQPIMLPEEIEERYAEDEEVQLVLKNINANKACAPMYVAEVNFNNEDIDGLLLHVEKGKLGLVRVEEAKANATGGH